MSEETKATVTCGNHYPLYKFGTQEVKVQFTSSLYVGHSAIQGFVPMVNALIKLPDGSDVMATLFMNAMSVARVIFPLWLESVKAGSPQPLMGTYWTYSRESEGRMSPYVVKPIEGKDW